MFISAKFATPALIPIVFFLSLPARCQSTTSTLDRFGGDTRLKSKINNAGVTFFGTCTRVTATSVTDRLAKFPTDGRLKGKLINPNYRRRVSSTSFERWFRIVANTATTITTDPSDGDLTEFAKAGDGYHVTGVFTTEKIGNRWWLIDPEGNAFFSKAVSATNGRGIWETTRRYDAIFLQKADGSFTTNLNEKAEDSNPADVVNDSGVTLSKTEDAIYIGALKPFNVTYFDLHSLGSGGKIRWYYSTGDSANPWRLLNGSGQPAMGASLNVEDGSYSLDIGNYLGPVAGDWLVDRARKPPMVLGEYTWGDPNANVIRWWVFKSLETGGNNTLFPGDLAPVALPVDGTPRFYIKGIVSREFTGAPVVNQIFDCPRSTDTMLIKYSAPGTDPDLNWLRATNERFRAWGWNAAGVESNHYVAVSATSPGDRMPMLPEIQLSTGTMQETGPWKIKNVYQGLQCPAGSGKIRPGRSMNPDVFDPAYPDAIEALAKGGIHNNPWTVAIDTEEADDIYGMGVSGLDHMGLAILANNPYQATSQGIPLKDRKLYSKYALRDFFRYRYKSATERLADYSIHSAVPAYNYSANPAGDELQALQSLNAAWGTAYSTWDTSSGNLADGSNAWGVGTGFMDENGRNMMPAGCKMGYDVFNKQGYPKVKQDLDDFVTFFAEKYGSILYPAVKKHTTNMMAVPLYNPPAAVAKGIGPYTDLLWTRFTTTAQAQEDYNVSHKPILNSDYIVADHDSPLSFGGPITGLSYDAARDTTIIAFSGVPYRFLHAFPVEFPDFTDAVWSSSPCEKLPFRPVPARIGWTEIEVVGNYAKPGCLQPGKRVRSASTRSLVDTQEERAEAITQRMKALIDAKGDDGIYFVAGWEHYAFMQTGLHFGSSTGHNYGLITELDNAYDGVEAKRAVSKDGNGRYIGGEDEDYGNLLGPLGPLLRGLYDKLIDQSKQ